MFPSFFASHLMEISPGCASAAEAASGPSWLRMCWVLECPGDREGLGGPKGLGRSISMASVLGLALQVGSELGRVP